MKQENWIKWDLNSRAGQRMGAFFTRTGALGYGAFVVFTELLYRSEENKLALNTGSYDSYAALFHCTVEEVRDILNILFTYELFGTDGQHFWSYRVLEEIEKRNQAAADLHASRSEAGQKGMKKRWQRNNNSNNLITTDNKGITNDNKHNQNRLDKNRLDNKNKSASALTSGDFIFPEMLNREVIKNAFQGWIDHRKELRKPLTKKAGELILQKYKDRPADLVRDIKHSIMGGYQGIFPPKTEAPKFQPNEGKHPLNHNQKNILERVKLKDPVPIGKVLGELGK